MRIEQVGSPQNVPKSQMPVLAEGDVMILKVTEIQDGRVVLKNPEGGLIVAKLLAEIGAAVGDYVETVVDEASGSRYVLRVVDTVSGQPLESAEAQLPAAPLRTDQTACLLNALTMLKMNPGADPKAAMFIARHGLPASAQNIETVTQLAKGTAPLAQTLVQIAKDAHAAAQDGTAKMAPQAGDVPAAGAQNPDVTFSAQTTPDNAAAGTSQTGQGRADAVQNTAMRTAASHAADNGQTAQTVISEAQPGQSAQTAVPYEMQTREPGLHTPARGAVAADAAHEVQPPKSGALVPETQVAVPETAGGTGQSKTELTDSVSSGFAKPVTESPQPAQALEQIAQKALALLGHLDDTDRLAAQIKHTVEDMPETLKELKLLADRADISNKETMTAKLDQAEKQLSLMNEVKRFDCYQIPLMLGHRETTADLFVFRYRQRKKTVDPENILIVLGLDTEYMGRVETLIKSGGKSVTLEFHLENMNAVGDVSAGFKQLGESVAAAGYSLADVSVGSLKTRTTVLNAEERLAKETGGSAANVDIRI